MPRDQLEYNLSKLCLNRLTQDLTSGKIDPKLTLIGRFGTMATKKKATKKATKKAPKKTAKKATKKKK